MTHSERRRLIPCRDLRATYGIDYSQRHLRRLSAAGLFPRLVKIGSGRNALNHVLADEMDQWLETKVGKEAMACLARDRAPVHR